MSRRPEHSPVGEAKLTFNTQEAYYDFKGVLRKVEVLGGQVFEQRLMRDGRMMAEMRKAEVGMKGTNKGEKEVDEDGKVMVRGGQEVEMTEPGAETFKEKMRGCEQKNAGGDMAVDQPKEMDELKFITVLPGMGRAGKAKEHFRILDRTDLRIAIRGVVRRNLMDGEMGEDGMMKDCREGRDTIVAWYAPKGKSFWI